VRCTADTGGALTQGGPRAPGSWEPGGGGGGGKEEEEEEEESLFKADAVNEEEEEEVLFEANAVNEEDPERDHVTPARKVRTTVLRSEGRLTPISPCYCTRE